MIKYLKGIFLTCIIAIISTLLGHFFPIIGSAIFAILIGILLNNTLSLSHSLHPGITFSSKNVLHYSIIMLGFTLSLSQIGDVGLQSLPIILITLLVCLVTIIILIRCLKIDLNTGILIGVGTAICGGSAIAATSPVIKAREHVIALSISTIFLFNLLGVILFPYLGYLFQMNQTTFGFFSGTAINDTSSVVAASSIYGSKALEVATIVKLTRTLFIIPVTIGLALWNFKRHHYQTHSSNKISIWNIMPQFIIGFMLASLISTIFNFSTDIIALFKTIAMFLITMALAGVGLSVKIQHFKSAGFKPLLLGLITWCILILTSLMILLITGMLS
ncbi:YeiH family protein [Staphylococcus felis]|uniref:YeiH family protein n=1 Tax=Staphylococcus felis TaxID=46127 RepID=UPI003966FE69